MTRKERGVNNSRNCSHFQKSSTLLSFGVGTSRPNTSEDLFGFEDWCVNNDGLSDGFCIDNALQHSGDDFSQQSSSDLSHSYGNDINVLLKSEEQSMMSEVASPISDAHTDKPSLESLINSTGVIGNTALCWAVISNQHRSLGWLLSHGVDVNLPNAHSGMTPLALACMHNAQPEVIRALIKTGADTDIPDNQHSCAIHYAARQADGRALAVLLESSIDVNVTDSSGLTPLMLGCLMGHEAVVDILAGNLSLNPRLQDKRGNTALHYACMCGEAKCLSIVLSLKPSVTVLNNLGETCLHFCVTDDNEECARLLLDVASANNEALKLCSCGDVYGKTPLDRAVENNALACVKLLQKHMSSTGSDSGLVCAVMCMSHLCILLLVLSLCQFPLTLSLIHPCFQSASSDDKEERRRVKTKSKTLSAEEKKKIKQTKRREYMRKYRAQSMQEYVEMLAKVEEVEGENTRLKEAVSTLQRDKEVLEALLVELSSSNIDTDTNINSNSSSIYNFGEQEQEGEEQEGEEDIADVDVTTYV
eukprot:m.167478 g.167478  ORF g.167478 m.167478 type:complete len:532 (-) comp13464_c2_seq4:113-1708(-)